MDNIIWTLKAGAVERSVDAWGFEAPQLSFASRAADVLTLRATADFDSAALFAYGTRVDLYQTVGSARRRVFAGIATSNPRSAADSAEYVDYVITGPWWYLDNKVYQEFWAGVGEWKSRVQLSYDDEGDKMSAQDTLRQILTYVIDAGAPIAIGDLTAITGGIPSEEVGDRTCAEVLELVLRWYPDAVTYWDYAAAVPALNIVTAATAPVIDVVEDGVTVQDVHYTRRDDIRVPGVAIKYERVDNEDGVNVEVVTTDAAGNPDGFGAMVVTVSLKGGSVTSARQRLRSAYIDPFSLGWWRKHVPQISGLTEDNALTLVELKSDERRNADDEVVYLPNEIIEGSHADWMPGDTGRVKVVATLRWRTGTIERTDDFTVTCSGTTLASGTYSTITGSEAPEETPEGLAAQIFAALDREHWEGSLVLVEAECSRWDFPGCNLRLRGADGLSVTFGPAQVQGVVMDLQTGVTTVSFGPAPVISAGDLVSLLRCNRNRRESSGPIKMRSGGGTGIVDGPKTTANDGAMAVQSLAWSIMRDVGESSQSVKIDLNTAPQLPAGTPTATVQLREGYMVANGQLRRILVPMSEDYPATT